MKSRSSRLLFAVAVLALVPVFGPAASMQQAPKRPIEVSDVAAWKTIGATVLSTDGQWFGYRDASLASPVRLTDQRPQVAQFAWSSGVQLVNYTSDKGDKLQAARFLPANYEKGRSYPSIVNFYEKSS